MAFPESILPIRAEMLINNAWVNVTSDVREENDITITGGFAPEQTSLSPCDIGFSLNNRDGLYSDDNPMSDYYGLLPTCTPFRVSIEESGTFAYLPNSLEADPAVYTDWDSGYISTSDKSVLDVTGDIDLRIEIEPETWQRGGAGHTLAAKYENSTTNRSWFWTILPTGRMRLYWSADGNDPTAAGTYADSTVCVPAGARVALRVTLDVNNGASGRTIVFYTSDSITGTWTQLGSTVVQSGTTSIFSGSGNLHVGAMRNLTLVYPFTNPSAPTPPSLPFVGRIYRFQMRSGIGGTLVADANPSAQAEGTTSWSDGLTTPNTWDLINDAVITKADYRAYGEIAEMPQEWDGTGADIYVPTAANGISRRLTQGASPLRSPIYRNLFGLVGAGAVGYWTGEGGTRTDILSNVVPGQPAGSFTGVSFGSDEDMPGSDGVMTLNDDNSVISGTVTGSADTDYVFALFYHKLPAAPLAEIGIFSIYLNGSIRRLTFSTSATSYRATAYDSEGVSLGVVSGSYGATGPGQWLGFQVRMSQNGTGVDLDLAWFVVGTTSFVGATTANVASATVGRVSGYSTMPDAALARAKFSHILLGNIAFEYVGTNFAPSSNAWAGELAGRRYLRVCREENVAARIIGWPGDTEPMGPQPLATLFSILDECVTIDGGLQFESRDQAALIIRTRRSLYAQTAMELDYSLKHLTGSFRPTLGDQTLRNQITASRPLGGSATASKETGPRSVASVGRYDAGITVNAYTETRLPALAEHAVFIGAWPDRRVPNVEAWLQRGVYVASSTLTRGVRALNPGSRLLVGNVPLWVGGGDADTLVRGYRETLKNRGHEVAFSTTPYGPYGNVNDLTSSASTHYRAAARNSFLAGAVTDSGTSMVLHTPAGALWKRSSGAPTGTYPMDVKVGGETATVGALANVTMTFVAVGTVSHGNNASVTPGLPAGLATGDLMFMLTAIRGTTAVSTTPSGWTSLTDTTAGGERSNLECYARIAQASGNAPTVTFSSGAAGDDTTAQIVAFRPSSPLYTSADLSGFVTGRTFSTNVSAQDIAYTGLESQVVALANSIILYLGWKQDDWTSVASPGTEIDEPDTTTGNDQGMVWAYTIQTTATAVASGSFVVTGGASAVSKGILLAIHPRHQLMSSITRSVNGITKAHSVGDAVQVADAFYVAL